MTERLRRAALRTAVAGAICAAASVALAAGQSATHSAAKKPDPEAIDAVVRMSTYLQTVKQFGLDVDSTTDQILVDGSTRQLVQLSHSTKLTVDRPGKLQADIVGGPPGTSRHVWFDGKTFTLYTEPGNYYASVPAPATIKELMSDLETRYGIELPLSDIFTLGTDPEGLKRVTSAVYLGDEMLNGKTCSHYAYHEKDIDWQLWTQKGSQPLPCKINIVTTGDKERPQYTAVYRWNLSPAITQNTFDFSPPQGAHQITFVQANEAR